MLLVVKLLEGRNKVYAGFVLLTEKPMAWLRTRPSTRPLRSRVQQEDIRDFSNEKCQDQQPFLSTLTGNSSASPSSRGSPLTRCAPNEQNNSLRLTPRPVRKLFQPAALALSHPPNRLILRGPRALPHFQCFRSAPPPIHQSSRRARHRLPCKHPRRTLENFRRKSLHRLHLSRTQRFLPPRKRRTTRPGIP